MRGAGTVDRYGIMKHFINQVSPGFALRLVSALPVVAVVVWILCRLSAVVPS